jgi:hypothetical protein
MAIIRGFIELPLFGNVEEKTSLFGKFIFTAYDHGKTKKRQGQSYSLKNHLLHYTTVFFRDDHANPPFGRGKMWT